MSEMTDAQAGTPSIEEMRNVVKLPEDAMTHITNLEAAYTSLELTVAALRKEVVELNNRASANIDPRLNGKVIPVAGRVQVDAVALGTLHQERDKANDLFDKLRQQHEWLRKDAEQASARCASLERGEFICKKCGLRKDAEHEPADF